jgi:hypothetical protein
MCNRVSKQIADIETPNRNLTVDRYIYLYEKYILFSFSIIVLLAPSVTPSQIRCENTGDVIISPERFVTRNWPSPDSSIEKKLFFYVPHAFIEESRELTDLLTLV